MFKEYYLQTKSATTMSKFAEFITSHSQLIVDNNDKWIYWCDESHSIGIRLVGNGSGDSIDIYCNNDTYKISGVRFNVSDTYDTYIQTSKNGAVTYLSQHKSTNPDTYENSPNIVFAKDATGNWAIIIGSTLYYKNGTVDIGSVGVEPDYNAPFSAAKVYNTATGAAFEELYKINSATIFSLRGTYVNFGGQGYRCVDGRIAKLYNALPCYAFPVADED